jgi:hypothetical protein
MRIGATHIDFVREFKAGDPPPSGYLEWHEWANAQERGGLRQRRCPICQKWRYPQEDCRSGKGCPSDKRTTT